jgi:hypothetical protein
MIYKQNIYPVITFWQKIMFILFGRKIIIVKDDCAMRAYTLKGKLYIYKLEITIIDKKD